MKRILSLGMLALTVLLATEQQAPAWVNSKFSVGLNWQWQSGNNSILWGLVKDGQVPGPEFCNPGYGGGLGYPGPQYGPQDFQYFGAAPRPNPNLGQPAQAPTPAPAQPAATAQQAYGYGGAPAWSNQNIYQPVSYNPYQYTPSYTPAYYTPTYYYPGNYPSYWYGR